LTLTGSGLLQAALNQAIICSGQLSLAFSARWEISSSPTMVIVIVLIIVGYLSTMVIVIVLIIVGYLCHGSVVHVNVQPH